MNNLPFSLIFHKVPAGRLMLLCLLILCWHLPIQAQEEKDNTGVSRKDSVFNLLDETFPKHMLIFGLNTFHTTRENYQLGYGYRWKRNVLQGMTSVYSFPENSINFERSIRKFRLDYVRYIDFLEVTHKSPFYWSLGYDLGITQYSGFFAVNRALPDGLRYWQAFPINTRVYQHSFIYRMGYHISFRYLGLDVFGGIGLSRQQIIDPPQQIDEPRIILQRNFSYSQFQERPLYPSAHLGMRLMFFPVPRKR